MPTDSFLVRGLKFIAVAVSQYYAAVESHLLRSSVIIYFHATMAMTFRDRQVDILPRYQTVTTR